MFEAIQRRVNVGKRVGAINDGPDLVVTCELKQIMDSPAPGSSVGRPQGLSKPGFAVRVEATLHDPN